MPQENGWATGPEHCDNDGRTCPYCGSENIDTGGDETQPGQIVECGCECLDCKRTWSNLYNIAGWYDDTDELHEDTRSVENREAVPHLQKQVKLLREAAAKVLDANCGDPWGLLDEGDQPRGGLDALKTALEATKEGA